MEKDTNNIEVPAGVCPDCAEAWDAILSASLEACGECWHLTPKGIQNLWERRWRQEEKWYKEWLYQL